MANKLSQQDQIVFLMGQVSVLGIAIQASLAHHPNKDKVAADIYESYEKCIARMTPTLAPDAFLEGMQQALDLYVLKRN